MQKYLVCLVAIVLGAIIVGRVALGGMWNENQKIMLTVMMAKDSEQDLARVMDGIRSCARNENIAVNVVYGSEWDEQEFIQKVEEEQQLGSSGILILYPENFLVSKNDTESFALRKSTILSLSDKFSDAFPYNASYQPAEDAAFVSDKELNRETIRSIMDGSMQEIFIPNEFQMGYCCMEALYQHSKGQRMTDVMADYLELTRETIEDGTYEELLDEYRR